MSDTGFRSRVREDCVRLKNGSLYRIRPVGFADREFMLACFEGLSPASRRQRFFGIKSSLTDCDLAFLTAADGRDHIALGAVRLDVWGREIGPLGAARCIREAPGSDGGELAMAVIDAAQGQGVGRALLAALIEEAADQGIRRFHCEVMAANQGMRALIRSYDGRSLWNEGGYLEYDFVLPEEGQDWGLARKTMDLCFLGFEGAMDLAFDLGRQWLERWPWSAEGGRASRLGHGRV